MNKRLLAVCAGVAMLASAFYPGSAGAAAPTIPAEVQIDDPVGDANFLNDQDNAYGTPAAGQGDHTTPQDVGSATDLMKVWFTNTKDTISLNYQVQGNPLNLAYDVYFRFGSNPGTGGAGTDTTRGCLFWVTWINGTGGGYTGDNAATIQDKCNVGGDPVVGELAVEDMGDGTFVVTMTFDRAYSPMFADGAKIEAPFGVVRVLNVGPSPQTVTAATIDTTQRGTEYVIMGGGPVAGPPPANPGDDAPGKGDPPGKGKKKGCKKGKGKKKGACKGGKDEPKPPASGCAAYQPGEEGADAETIKVTNEATSETPLEITVTQDPGLGNDLGLGVHDEVAHSFRNVQVDTVGPDMGLFIRYEFPPYEDHDLYVNYADGSEAAHVGGFNATPVAIFDGTGAGGHSEQGAEQLDGLRTADCAGYTVDFANFLGEGGEYTVKLWLGDVQNEPAAPGSRMVMDVMNLF